MPEFRISIMINKSVDIVLKAYLEPGNIVHWTKDLERFEVVKGEAGLVGSIARLHYLQDGQRYVMEDRLIHVDPGKRYVSQVSSDFLDADIETTFESTDEGTRMTVFWKGRPKILSLRLLSPFLRGKMAREATKELEVFKSLVETRGVDFSQK